MVVIGLAMCTPLEALAVMFTPPTINPLAVGVPVAVQVGAASVCPDSNHACSVAISTTGVLPAGLALVTHRGLLSETPRAPGHYSLMLVLEATEGNSGPTIHAGAAGVPVTITRRRHSVLSGGCKAPMILKRRVKT